MLHRLPMRTKGEFMRTIQFVQNTCVAIVAVAAQCPPVQLQQFKSGPSNGYCIVVPPPT